MDTFFKHFSEALFEALMVSLLALMFSTPAIASDTTEVLFIDSVVEPEAPYIQQQVKYTLRLWRKSHLQRGYFLTPDIPDVLIIPAPTAHPRIVTRDGEEYELLQQSYFIFPQSSGNTRLPPPVFSSQDLFIKGEPLILKVKPAVTETNMQQWLITSKLTLQQQWQLPAQPAQPGQPVERKIIIRGEGVTGAQLPRLDLQPIKDMHIQRLASKTRHELINDQVHGTRTERIRYLPLQTGDYQFNAIKLYWWNSLSDAEMNTALPAHKIHITTASEIQNAQSRMNGKSADTDSTSMADKKKRSASDASAWLWIVLLTVIVPVAYLCRKNRLYQHLLKHIELYHLRRAVLHACRDQDASALKNSLLQWAQVKFKTGKSTTLLGLKQFTTDPFVIEVLLTLDEVIYNEQPLPYTDEVLQRALQQFMSSTVTGKRIKNRALPAMWRINHDKKYDQVKTLDR